MKIKKRITALLMTMCVAASSTIAFAGEYSGFSDVPDNSAYAEAVKYCRENSLMAGTSKTEFSPNENTSRAMLVTILHRNEGTPVSTAANTFADIAENSWYANAVRWAAENGIVNGVDTTHFAPDDLLTREQILAIIWRMEESPEADTTLLYSDTNTISDYARTALQWAAQNKIIENTNGRLNPQGYITRAEMAQILYNYLTMDIGDEGSQDEDNTIVQTPAASAGTIIVTINKNDFTMNVESNTTTQMLLAALGNESMNLPVYNFDGYENDDLYQYYDIPSRYNVPTNPVQIDEQKAGQVFIDEENRVYLFFRDAKMPGQYTKIGEITNTTGLADAVENNPTVPGWSNKIITLKRGADD